MYCFAHSWSYDEVIFEDVQRNIDYGYLSTAIVADWQNYNIDTETKIQIIIIYKIMTMIH